jgi:hypothetical protein
MDYHSNDKSNSRTTSINRIINNPTNSIGVSMIQIDGKTVDLTNPQTWGNSIQIKPNGFIEQTKDGMTTLVQPIPQPLKEAK